MATPLTLRAASPSDVDALTSIWHQGWRDGHLGNVPAALLAHRDRVAFRRRLPAQIPATTVAVLDGRVVGFVTVHHDEVEQLYVAAAARGSGVAGALLRRAEQLVAGDGHARSWLAVVPGNARARRFYEREGWHDTGPLEYEAAVADGATVAVPCRRYEKVLHPAAASVS